MIEIDGSVQSGSGTLLRYAVALATLIGKPLYMNRIRTRRPKPGLRPQHLRAVNACCALSRGRLQGAEVGSQELHYWPGERLEGGHFSWDIGTAGSATMLAFTLIPVALFASGECRFTITGGLFQDFAPSFFHMERVLVPLIQRMGAQLRLEMIRPGYVPKGGGRLVLEVRPLGGTLRPLLLADQGRAGEIRGIALASHLQEERVGPRMAGRSQRLLEQRGYRARVDTLEDTTALQKGAALALWAQTHTGCILGGDQAGRPGRRSESIAGFVVNSLLEDMNAGATTDRHVADQLILFAALGRGTTVYRIPTRTEHVEANLWLVEKVLAVKAQLKGSELRLEGIGFHRPKR